MSDHDETAAGQGRGTNGPPTPEAVLDENGVLPHDATALGTRAAARAPRPEVPRVQKRVAFVLAGLTLALVAGAGCSSTQTIDETDAATPPTAAAPASPPASSTTGRAATSGGSAVAGWTFTELERRYGARVGLYAVDTGSGREVRHRDQERFAYASTIKALAAAAVLARSSPADLQRTVTYDESELVPHSPVTERHVDEGMSLRAVCDAAVRFSDNTAGNLLFRELGGPGALDRQLAAAGDTTTQVVRTEPSLNEAEPGDERDTSTPAALAADLQHYVLGDDLDRSDRALLTGWLRGNTTGDELIRAGVPDGWVVGDKTGAGGYGTRNDIAIIWPPGRAPLVLVVMSDRDEADADYDNTLIADATRAAVEELYA